jgi:hypothetical protein
MDSFEDDPFFFASVCKKKFQIRKVDDDVGKRLQFRRDRMWLCNAIESNSLLESCVNSLYHSAWLILPDKKPLVITGQKAVFLSIFR